MYISWGAEKFRLWYSRVETFQTPVVCKLAESIFNREKVTKPILYFRTGSGEFVAPHSQRCVFQPCQHIGHAYKIAAFLNCSICGMLNLLWLRQWLIKIYVCKLAWNIDSCTALNEIQKLVTDPLRWLGFTVHRQRGKNLCGKLKLGVYVRRALNWKFIIRSGSLKRSRQFIKILFYNTKMYAALHQRTSLYSRYFWTQTQLFSQVSEAPCNSNNITENIMQNAFQPTHQITEKFEKGATF